MTGKVAGIAGLVLLVLFVLLIIGAFTIGQQLVYIFIIFAALFSLLAFALLGYAALQIVALVRDLRGEVQVLVGTAQDTLAEVQGTARFVNASVVGPVSQAAGWVSAVRGTVKSFTEPLFKRKS